MESMKLERKFGRVSEENGQRKKNNTREGLFPKIRTQRDILCNVYIEKKSWNESKEWLKEGWKLQRNVGGDKSCFRPGLKGLNKESLAK